MKLMDIMFSLALGRRVADKGVTVNCCCLGFNTTGLGRDLPLAGVLERILMALHVGDPRRGAGIIVKLATDPAFAETASGYYSVKTAGPLDPPEYGRSEKIQAELWQATAPLVDRSLR
jgi:NAD(P)-dependent dehydrogenase (short-subunit alcohol dehydrogenase family)